MAREEEARFSARTDWSAEDNRWCRARDRRIARGDALLDLTLSNPTQAGLPYAEEALCAALGDPRVLVYEPHAVGSHEARVAIAASSEENGAAVAPDDLVLCASTSEAYGWLFKLLCERRDQVLVPRPSYPLLEFLAELEEVELVRYPLVYEGRWGIDLDALSSLATHRTRAIVVIHPNNPTGNLVTADEAAALQRLAVQHRLAVVSDEVFLSTVSEAHRPPSLATGSPPALTFALDGLSKSAGLPQLKLAWIHVAGPTRAKHEALRRLAVIGDTYLSVNTPVQIALPAILAHRDITSDAVRARCRANRSALDRRLTGAACVTRLEADGGWSAVLRVPAIQIDEDWAIELITSRGVLVHPGEFFDFRGGAHLIVSLLAEPTLFEEGVDRLVAHILARS